MTIRTFYWDPVAASGRRARLRLRRPEFRTGNAGDLYNTDLLAWAYPGHAIRNDAESGGRLLLVGSVAHRAMPGDLLNGVGSKGVNMPGAHADEVQVRGVRGPMTLAALASAGFDVSSVEFMGDPGLLIAHVYPDVLDLAPETGRVLFIPHYRERQQFRSCSEFTVIDIDARPRAIAEQIAGAAVVHTSSLHGLVWAHALRRPVRLVAPLTGEPEFKYRDYFASTGLPFEWESDLRASLSRPVIPETPDLSPLIAGISLPTATQLSERGIIGL